LDDLAYEGFFPDIIIIDYADVMAPSEKTDYRNQIDGIWKRLRALAQKRKAVVFTASQTNRGAISREVETEDVAEDIRKIAHVTSMISISKTKYCKKNSLAIYSQLAVREGKPETRKVIATQCLYLGRPVIESHWKDEVILDDEDEKKVERKRK
jgi:replicative DNA helicase